MLEALQQIATSLGLPFSYGTQNDLNILADSHTEGFLLFHEGYFRAEQSITTAGHLIYAHNLSYLILTPSKLADTVTDRSGYLDELKPMNEQILSRLILLGRPSGLRVTMNLTVNLTDRNMDALRQTLNLTTDAVSLC